MMPTSFKTYTEMAWLGFLGVFASTLGYAITGNEVWAWGMASALLQWPALYLTEVKAGATGSCGQ
jgi:hypothetical protein